MDPRALLLWGLAVWLSLSTQECAAAVFRGRDYSQDGTSGSSPPQIPATGLQDATLGSQEPATNQGAKNLQDITQVIGNVASPTPNKDSPKDGSVVKTAENPPKPIYVADNLKEHPTSGSKSSSGPASMASMPDFVEDGVEEEDENGTIHGKYSYIEEDGVPATIEYEAVPKMMKFVIKNYIKASKILPVPVITEVPEGGRALMTEISNENPVGKKDNQNEHSASGSKSSPEPASQASMPDFVEDGVEEEDENGTIHGKYSYIEEDGDPATLEYEAVPNMMKFVIKNYIKASKILPVPIITEDPESERALITEILNENPVEKKEDFIKDGLAVVSKGSAVNSKTITNVLGKDPEYEHASVIARSQKLIRKTRTIHDQEYETPNENKSEYSADASYKFGFSADGQTRNEEADSQGNVQGSYSYIGEDGMLTKVEYEAGSGKGFIVKRIVQEDTKRSLKDKPQSSDPMSLEQPLVKLNSKDDVSPPISLDQADKSEDHQIQSPYKKDPSVTNSQKSDEAEEIGNAGKINTNSDGSYSFSYATPDQWREESVDSKGHIKGRYSFIAQGGSKIKSQYTVAPFKELHSEDFGLPLTHLLQAPKSNPIPTFTNLKTQNLKMNSDGSYTFSYVTPNQFRAEVAHAKGHESFLSKVNEVPQENKESPGVKDFLAPQNTIQTNDAANVDNSSPIQNDGSYSYSFETPEQMRQEAGGTDGNVQGQFSYISNDGIRRTVHYNAGPESGFTAEGSHLPSTENLSNKYSINNHAETKTSVTSSGNSDPNEAQTLPADVDDMHNVDSSIKNINEENLPSPQRAEVSSQGYSNIVPTVGYTTHQGPDSSPQVFLDLSGIRRAVAVKDNGKTKKHKQISRKHPTEPITANTGSTLIDGSYSFAYDTKDHIRRESVDPNGNVYSGYQYKTNDDGKTVVVFIRKRVKDGVNGNTRSSRNLIGKQANRNTDFDDINGNIRAYRSYVTRNGFSRKRHVQGLLNPSNRTPVDMRFKQPVQAELPNSSPNIESTNENKDTKNYRQGKSGFRPFRGTVKYERQII